MSYDIEHPENNPEFKGLNVNKGVDQPPQVNPNLGKFRKKRKGILTLNEYVDGILAGNITVLSQAVTLVESNLPDHYSLAQEIIEKCLPHSGNSFRLGITGVPGAGKSTFIEALGMHIINQKGKLAVLAIDPSSERSRGSILGDKTRMEQLSAQSMAYIRPSPSAGTLGGVARKTRETIILCEAAGFDHIFIETVGVGQSETAVHSMVDFFLLIMLAGAGDELQGIKRGIMEMADAIAINKADGSNIEKAQQARVQYNNALHLFPASPSGWKPEVVTCSALTNNGIADLWEMINRYLDLTIENNYFYSRRKEQSSYWMRESINEKLLFDFYNHPAVKASLKTEENLVLNKVKSSFIAAADLLKTYFDILKNDR